MEDGQTFIPNLIEWGIRIIIFSTSSLYDILILTFEIKISDLVVKNELCCRLCKNIQF